ncbi:hypothetical protein [Paraburkholderia sp. BCC1886]|uniref:hypothetical protein n=1 Tax=Paraburkholderia sp. BCC1886 TaxID=2562670 RepID=UPI0011828750|nr:hypothetical protein [Paraburkholderia sp. BCC1886]
MTGPLRTELAHLRRRIRKTGDYLSKLSSDFWRRGGICCPSCGVEGYSDLQMKQERREKRLLQLLDKLKRDGRKIMDEQTVPIAKKKTTTLVEFIQRLSDEGCFAGLQSPEAILAMANGREDRPGNQNAFLVTVDDSLNELTPAEVLSGEPFIVNKGRTTRGIYSSNGWTEVPLTEADIRAHIRVLAYPLERRLAMVLRSAQTTDLEEQ